MTGKLDLAELCMFSIWLNERRWPCNYKAGSSGWRVVKLFACGAREPGVGFPASPLEFSEIGYLMLPSRDMAEIPLKRCKSWIQPTNQLQSKIEKVPRDIKVKSIVKTWQVRGIWSQRLEHKQVPKRGTKPGVRKGIRKRSLLACHTRYKCSITCDMWQIIS